MKHIFYNQLSGDGRGKEIADAVALVYGKDCVPINMAEIEDLSAYCLALGADDAIVILGGDGTLNNFVNRVDADALAASVYYLPTGTGNDFACDLGKKEAREPFEITKYIKNLPTVTVNGETHKFINGVGFGIDGYCCEVGDKEKAKGKKPDYTAIAILGLLFHFKPKNATVTVDGVVREFERVWIAPTMFGRYYGGGMNAAPNQDRGEEVSLVIFGGAGRIKTLMEFPSIFKGEHIKSKLVTILTGKEINVKFGEPCPLQIDGETVLGVTEYTVKR